MLYTYNIKIVRGEFLGLTIGSVWASVFLIWKESTLLVFTPFIVILIIFMLMLLTCIWGRLKTHSYFTLKQQEKLLKKSLLQKSHATGNLQVDGRRIDVGG